MTEKQLTCEVCQKEWEGDRTEVVIEGKYYRACLDCAREHAPPIPRGTWLNYITEQSDHCPRCGSTNIEGGSYNPEGNLICQKVGCTACELEWTETYKLFRIEDENWNRVEVDSG